MANFNACEIKDLTLNIKSIYIVGVVIAKTDVRTFESKNSVITFTIRDSKHHFINCTVWGTDHYVDNCNSAYKIGDIIVINRPVVSQKNSEIRYMPQTTSPFTLRLDEGKGFIYRESNQNHIALSELKGQTIKSTSLSLNLADVVDNRRNSSRVTIDLLVVVRAVHAMRTIQTKSGQKTLRKITLMDPSLDAMQLTMWHPEYIERANHWIPMETILHLVDVRVEYSEFEKSTVLALDNRTIITENPVQASRATSLMEYLNSLDPLVYGKIKDKSFEKQNEMIDITAIKDVMSVRKVLDIIKGESSTDVGDVFTAIVYAVLTKLNIDPRYGRNPIVKCCIHCQRFIQQNNGQCDNVECLSKPKTNQNYVEKFYISLDLTDHSGTLTNCHLMDEYASRFLQYTVEHYKQLSEPQIDQIKAKYFMERFNVKIRVKRSHQSNTFVAVLDISAEDSNTVAQNIKVY